VLYRYSFLFFVILVLVLQGCNGGRNKHKRKWQEPEDFKEKRSLKYNPYLESGLMAKKTKDLAPEEVKIKNKITAEIGNFSGAMPQLSAVPSTSKGNTSGSAGSSSPLSGKSGQQKSQQNAATPANKPPAKSSTDSGGGVSLSKYLPANSIPGL